MKSKLVYQKTTKLVKIDAGLHKELKKKAADDETTIKGLIEDALIDVLEVKTKKR